MMVDATPSQCQLRHCPTTSQNITVRVSKVIKRQRKNQRVRKRKLDKPRRLILLKRSKKIKLMLKTHPHHHPCQRRKVKVVNLRHQKPGMLRINNKCRRVQLQKFLQSKRAKIRSTFQRRRS